MHRGVLQWSQNDLAGKAGISPVTIQRLEQAASNGDRAKPIQNRTLLPIVAALHRQRRLEPADLQLLLVAAGVPGARRPEAEQSIRRMAGEFDGLEQRLADQGRKQDVSLLDELLARQPKELFEIQAIATLMGNVYGLQRTLDALRGIKATFDAEAARLKPPPGAIAHQAEGATTLTPTSPPSSGAVGAKLKPRRQG